MYIKQPEKNDDGRWFVEIVNYPESRSVETYTFDTEALAQEFFDANRHLGLEQSPNNPDTAP